MKKLNFKFISFVLGFSVAVSLLSTNVMAENITLSATEKTRIEGEAATEIFGGGYKRKMLNDGSKYALTYSPIAPASGMEYYAVYTVDAPLAGNYSLNAVASIRSQTYTTDWTIYANTPDNAVTSYVQGAAVTTDWFSGVFKEYNCGTIYLNKGINNIYWKINVADAASNQLQSALDYIELTPPKSIMISSTDTTKIEGEAYTGATITPNIRTMNNPDDGQKAVNYVSFKPADYSGKEFIVTYNLNVEKEGYYNLTSVGSFRGQDYTSDWKLYVDTEENAVTSYTKIADVTTTKFLQNLFKQYNCGKIYLNEGINTLYWKVDRNDAPNGLLQAALDYIEFSPVVISVPKTGTTKIEGEAYTAATVKPNIRTMNSPDDGKKAVNYVSYKPENYSGEEFITEYYLSVEEEGYYDITAVASIRSQDYTSDWTIYADTEENTVSAYNKVADVTTTNFLQNVFKEYNCGRIYLNKGINTLCWKVNRNDAPSGVLQAALDYIELTLYVPIVVEIGNETVVEAETGAKGAISAIGASGEMILGSVSGKKENTVSLNVSEAGEYMVEVCGTDAKASVSFDGGNAVTLGSSSTIRTMEGSYFDDGLYPYNTYVLSNPVSLTQGEHTITITVNGDTAGAAVDYVKLTKMNDISDASVDEIEPMNIGDSANINVNGIDTSDMYMVTYSSRNEAVAYVDGNGKVTATGSGETLVDVIIKKYAISKEYKVSVKITVNSPVSISNVSLSNGKFNADINKNTQLEGDVKAYIATYHSEDLKRFKSVECIDVNNETGKQNISISLNTEKGNLIGMFVWYGEDITPLCNPIFIKAE